MQRDLGFIGSSEDATKVGDTVKGIILLLSATIITVSGHYGFSLGEPQVVDIATGLGGAVGALWTLYGLIKKLTVKATA